MTDNIPDLGAYKLLSRLAQEREQAQLTEQQEKDVVRWDRAMTKTFKGIVPRSTRLAFMRAHGKRLERGES